MIVATMVEAKTNLSRLAAQANETGESITVLKNKKPWIEICPLAYPGRNATTMLPGPSAIAHEDELYVGDDGVVYEHVKDPLPPETLEALREAEDIKAHPEKYKRYDDLEELFADLGLR